MARTASFVDRVLTSAEARPFRSASIVGGLIAGVFAIVVAIDSAYWPFGVVLLLLALTAGVTAGTLLMRRARRQLDYLALLPGAVWGLSGLLPNGVVLPALGGSAVDPLLGHEIASLIVERQPTSVVELGPGTSTLLIDAVARTACPALRVTGLEHDPAHYERLRRWLDYLEVTCCDLIHAPLEEQECNPWRGRWYAKQAVAKLPDRIELLLVDGPPNMRGRGSRFPAYPKLRGHLKAGALIVVDDTHRRDERATIDAWLQLGGLAIRRDGGHYMVLEVVGPETDG